MKLSYKLTTYNINIAYDGFMTFKNNYITDETIMILQLTNRNEKIMIAS